LLLQLGKKETEADLVDAPAPILPNLFATGTFDFFDLDPIEFARQLTVSDSGDYVHTNSNNYYHL